MYPSLFAFFEERHFTNEVIITGDYYIEKDKPGEIENEHFIEILYSATMVQQVNERTDTYGHITDLIVTREH